LEVMGVNSSATINGTFPLSGALHTLNSSLTIGKATVSRGIDDPNTSATKEVGVTDYTFASVKATADSAEKVRIHSLRWNQSGSVSASDLANLKTYVDGVAYDVTVSADGKYYTADFGSGLVIDKGMSKEMSIKGDIESGSGRTIIFDIYKSTDLYVTGETYGYGITPTDDSSAAPVAKASIVNSAFTTGTPWYNNVVVTVSNGSLSVSKATSIAAQNISENVANQVLGGFDIEAKGETISIASMIFQVVTSGTGMPEDITNISLVDGNGSVVAGPVDGDGDDVNGTITFSDTVTIPVGEGTYTLKGQLGTAFENNETVHVTTTPGDDWTTITGETTGNSITATPATLLQSNTMTLKAGTVSISVSDSPVAQNIVGGAQGFTFANYQFDATASGEDVRFTSLILELAAVTSPEYLTGCQLWDGSTALNTGPNKKDPASTDTAGDITFTLDSGGVTIPKGTVKTLALKCDLSSSADGETYLWDMVNGTTQTGTGLNSGTEITALSTGAGQTMTAVSEGGLVMSEDSGSYSIAAAGTTDVTLGSVKFTGTNENITLTKVGLILTAASSTPSNLNQVTLWDGTTKVGSAIFTGDSYYATSTLTGTFTVPKDGNKVMTIKGDLAEIGTTGVGTQGALLIVNAVTENSSTQGVGAQSGGTVTATAGPTAFDGVRVFRSYPTFAQISETTTTGLTGGATNLYKFSVAASAGDGEGIGIGKFTLNLSTSTDNSTTGSTTISDLKVFAYTDAGFSVEVDQAANNTAYTEGQIVTGFTPGAVNDLTLINPLQIPAGETYYFKVVGTVTIASGTGTSANNWVKTEIVGDSAYPINSARLLDLFADVDPTDDDFIWSPYATTTSAKATHYDWTNGYKVSGLDGMEYSQINQ